MSSSVRAHYLPLDEGYALFTHPIPDQEPPMHILFNTPNDPRKDTDGNWVDPFTNLPFWGTDGALIEKIYSPLIVDPATNLFNDPGRENLRFYQQEDAVKHGDMPPKMFKRLTRNVWMQELGMVNVNAFLRGMDVSSHLALLAGLFTDSTFQVVPRHVKYLLLVMFVWAQMCWFALGFCRAWVYGWSLRHLHEDSSQQWPLAFCAMMCNFMFAVPRMVMEAPKIIKEGSQQTDERDASRQLVPLSASYIYTLRFRDNASYEFFGHASNLIKSPIVFFESTGFLAISLYIQRILGHMTIFTGVRAIMSGGFIIRAIWNLSCVLRMRADYHALLNAHANCEHYTEQQREAARKLAERIGKRSSMFEI